MAIVSTVGLGLLLQTVSTESMPARPVTAPLAVVTASAAIRTPVIDGVGLDDAWATAPAITEFREARPVEGAEPRFPTDARVTYDPRNLYVLVRAFDPHPDSIVRRLARRDSDVASDWITLYIDSYHDRRTGYRFSVNPAGVKRDRSVFNDGDENDAWDGVWEVATTVDSAGWTAEFRIPLSQLRYSIRPENTFGFSVRRWIARHTAEVSWPLYRVSRPGTASQLGELTGLAGLETPRRAELVPYVVAKSNPVPVGSGFDQTQRLTAGGDLKYGVGSNITLNATVNPDFGQVEADPAVLNLGAFETFYRERRPFFVEGTGLFRFPVNCNVVNDCNTGEGLFYSRRIGRAPQLTDQYEVTGAPTATTILGAAKLTARVRSGLSVGLLDAVTRRAHGAGDVTVQPATNHAALRAQQDLRRGESSVGVMLTGVQRGLDSWSEPYVRRDAYVGAVDFRHRFLGQRYQVSGSLDLSRVAGSAAAITATQRDPVHYYQRPDDAVALDSGRTSLAGHAAELLFGKFGGQHVRFETSYQRRSAGFEINDLGFLRRADQQSWNTWAQFRLARPRAVFQELYWNGNVWHTWTAAGLATDHAFNTNVHTMFNNRWWFHGGGTLGQLAGVHCDRCARGGPAVRVDRVLSAWSGIQGDSRRAIRPQFWLDFRRADGGRSRSIGINPSLDVKLGTRFATQVSVDYTRNRDHTQWYDNFTDASGATHHTFAHLEQRELSFTWRLDYTLTPEVTLQVYAQPFVSKGTYSDVRELADPRADRYEDRYRPYGDATVTANPGGFNVKQFRSNVVFRWEYRPGSTLFLVWQQGRADDLSTQGVRSFGGDLGEMFRLRADNTFLLKTTYWINW